MTKKMHRQKSKIKALDEALWLNFKNRVSKETVGVVESIEGDYIIISPEHPTFKGDTFEILPKNYKAMDYEHIKSIGSDLSPLPHWEAIDGMISTMDGEILRFILHYKVPLKRFIRYELACRGFDENHKWCGFDKAKKIWLK